MMAPVLQIFFLFLPIDEGYGHLTVDPDIPVLEEDSNNNLFSPVTLPLREFLFSVELSIYMSNFPP